MAAVDCSRQSQPLVRLASVLKGLPFRVQACCAGATAFLLCGLPWILVAAVSPQLFEEVNLETLPSQRWGSLRHLCTVLSVFILFEPGVWLLHRYGMHGAFWFWHKDHHDDTAYSKPELYWNDAFALFFAVPSSTIAMLAYIGLLSPAWVSVTEGAGLYGLAYAYVHEELFHHRFGFPGTRWARSTDYVKRLATAHGVHHRTKTIEGDSPTADNLAFGFLYAPPRFSPDCVRRLPKSCPKETLWDYYGPLFGVYSELDRLPNSK